MKQHNLLSFEMSAFGLNEQHKVKRTNNDEWIVKATHFFSTSNTEKDI